MYNLFTRLATPDIWSALSSITPLIVIKSALSIYSCSFTSLDFFLWMIVFLPIKKATRTSSTGIITISQLIRYATSAAAKNAVMAVKNQPPTTLITPATL